MAIEPQNDRDAHGSSRIDSVAGDKKTNWLPWIIGALALLALLYALTQCKRDEPVPIDNTMNTTETTTTTTNTMSGETAAAGTAAAAGAATGDALGDMTTYVGSGEAAGRRFSFDTIKFATNSAVVPTDAKATVDGIAGLLKSNAGTAIRIEGYADAKGAAGANKNLGSMRANSVKQALIAAGIMSGRITTATGGENNPVDSNATADGRSENRRTDVVVTKK